MTRQEKKLLYKYWDNLPKDYIDEIARYNQQTSLGLKHNIEQELYLCRIMKDTDLKKFISRLSQFDEEEQTIIEHINHISIKQIYKIYGGNAYDEKQKQNCDSM